MGDNKTTTQTGSSSSAVTNTTNKLLGGLSAQYDKGTAVFDKNLFTGAGDTTQNSWASALGAANNPDYANGINGAISDYSRAASGGDAAANDPYYAKLGDNALRDVNAMFTNSGRFGSGSHVNQAVTALGDVNNANIAADRAWQTQGAQMLPGLLQAGQLPSSIQGAVGSAQDANTQGLLQGANDLFRRQNDSGWSTLGQASSILNGAAPAAGQTQTTTSPQAPWWQQGLGAAALGAGIYGSIF
jgi:hypothetical protein